MRLPRISSVACLALVACVTDPVAPPANLSAPSYALARGDYCGDGLSHANGFTAHPLGDATLAVNSTGNLVVDHIAPDTPDGACFDMATHQAMHAHMVTPLAFLAGEAVQLVFKGGGATVAQATVRRRAGKWEGTVSLFEGCYKYELMMRRNGQPVSSESAEGESAFTLPDGFRLTEIGFEGSVCRVIVRGVDANNRAWAMVAKSSGDASAPRLNRALLAFLSRKSEYAKVELYCED